MGACDTCKTKLPRGYKDCPYCKDVQLVDHVLMYAECHRHTSAKDVLVRTMAGYYSSDDILNAKDLLIKHFGEFDILNDNIKKARQSSNNRTHDMANCDDIVVILNVLEEKHVQVICVTNKWWKIPKVQPESFNDLSIAEKVAELEAKFALYDKTLCNVKTEITKHDSRLSEVESENTAQNVQLEQLVVKNNSKTQTINTPSYASKVNEHVDKPGPDLPNPKLGGISRLPKKGNPEVSRQRSNSTPTGDSDGFIRPADQVRREARRNRNQQKRQGVMGKATGPGLISATGPSRDLFVTYVSKECDLDTMRQHIRSTGVVERSLTIKEGDDYNSFILKVAAKDAEQMKDPEIWPEGVFVRRYYPAKKQ